MLNTNIAPETKDVIITGLTLAVVVLGAVCLWLYRLVIRERHKRTIPHLSLDMDTADSGVYLINDGFCDAKDIIIQDAHITLEYEFKKTLTIKFTPITLIKAGERLRVEIKIFDGEYDVTQTAQKSIAGHLMNSSAQTQLTCSNLYNTSFKTILVKDKGTFSIKELQIAR